MGKPIFLTAFAANVALISLLSFVLRKFNCVAAIVRFFNISFKWNNFLTSKTVADLLVIKLVSPVLNECIVP